MDLQIENLKALIRGEDLNIYQTGKALREFNKLLNYVDELEKLPVIHSFDIMEVKAKKRKE